MIERFEQGFRGPGDVWKSVVDSAGVMRCSCGRKLVKLDELTYQCPGGWPIYRFDQQDIIKDKFGNLLFRSIPHDNNSNNEGGE